MQQNQNAPTMHTIWEFIYKQGFNIALLAFISWTFWGKVEILEKKLDDCQNSKLELIQTSLNQNTKAINELQTLITEIKDEKEAKKK